MRKAAVALALLAAGCGGADETGAIRAALVASSATYLHYGARTWGRTPHVEVRIRIEGDRANAVLSASRTSPQHVTLLQRDGSWRISAVEPGVVTGPQAVRAATAHERQAIASNARRTLFHSHDSCVTYLVEVSTLDPRYARVRYRFRRPYAGCRLGNGESIFRRSARRWTHLADASDGFPCSYLPAGVVRSLFGACWTFKR